MSATQDVGYRAGNSVSATRISTPIKDLPFAVSAFTEQFIADIGARDLWDIVQFAPSVTSAGREFNSGNSVYNIRGFDQAPQHDGFVGESYIDTVTVERVEVVKGPASVLYGQVSPGGIVNYITKRPGDNPFGRVALKGGSYSYFRTELDANQPLISKKVLFRFNGAWENGMKYVDYTKAKTTVVSPSLTWNINDRISLNVTHQWFMRTENAPAQMLPNIEIATAASMLSVPINPKAALSNSLDASDPGFLSQYPVSNSFNYSSKNDLRKSDFESVNAELRAKIASNWTARANFNWNKSRVTYKSTGLGTVYVSAPTGFTDQEYAAAVLADRNVALLSDHAYLLRRPRLQKISGQGIAIQTEAAGQYKFGGVHFTPLVGAYYTRDYNKGLTSQKNIADYFPAWDLKNPGTIDPDTDYDVNTLPAPSTYTRSLSHSKAAYAVLNARFLDERLIAIAGLRYNNVDSQTWNLRNNTTDGTFKAHRTTAQTGLGFKITPDMLLYASYSQSFVQNAASLMYNGQPAGPAKPTTAEGYEAGLKTDFLGGRISSTVAIFQIEQNDRLVRFNSFLDGVTYSNTAQGMTDRSRGVEAEITYSPYDNWQIYASISQVDIRTIKVPAGYEYYLGARPEATAKSLANLWTRYTFEHGALKGFWLGGGFNYTGKKAQRTNNRNLFLPAYWLLNASVGYDWKWKHAGWSAVLEWKNITDEYYLPANQQRGLPSRINATLSMKF